MNLKQGQKSDEVKLLQTFLNSRGYSVGAVDGDFGAKTELALQRWQLANGLDADGIFGAKSLEKAKTQGFGAAKPVEQSSSKTLTEQDYRDAAKLLKCSVAAIKAVAEVESRGDGFDSQGRPKILFERHKFAKYTNGKFVKSHPHICNWKSGGYGKESAQYERFSEAFALDSIAAMMSASWGKFQIMGFNHKICGYGSVGEFVDAMKVSEGKHLIAFCEFVKGNNLDRFLRSLNWAAFAKGYNGEGYKKNNYDTKMASAYRKYSA